MKYKALDHALCPSCGHRITREAIYELFKKDHSASYQCPHCLYDYGSPPYRPLTINEMLKGRKMRGSYEDVSLEQYTVAVIKLYEQHLKEHQ